MISAFKWILAHGCIIALLFAAQLGAAHAAGRYGTGAAITSPYDVLVLPIVFSGILASLIYRRRLVPPMSFPAGMAAGASVSLIAAIFAAAVSAGYFSIYPDSLEVPRRIYGMQSAAPDAVREMEYSVQFGIVLAAGLASSAMLSFFMRVRNKGASAAPAPAAMLSGHAGVAPAENTQPPVSPDEGHA